MKYCFFNISNSIVKYYFECFVFLYAVCNLLFAYWINNLSF